MRDVKVNKKYCQTGLDALEFVILLDGMEDMSFDEEILPNKNSKSIVTIKCNSGRISGSISAVHCIRDTNEKPFRISDCVKMDCIRNQVFEFIKDKMKEHLGKQYNESYFKDSNVTAVEMNITLPCVGKATPYDMAHLIDMVFGKTTVYRKRKKDSKCEKENSGVTYERKHYYFLKCYSKLDDFERQNLPTQDDKLFRLEIVFKDRKLDSMFGKNNRTLENVLSAKSFDVLCREYKVVLEEIIEQHIKPYLDNCVETLYQSLNENTGGKSISDTVCRYKEIIVDMHCLRRALHKYYANRQKYDPNAKDHTDEMIYKYRKKNLGIPQDVLATLKAFHEAAG